MTKHDSSNPHDKPATAQHHEEHAPELEPVSARSVVLGIVVVLLVFAVLAVFGILKRGHDSTVLAKTTEELAVPSVIALPPKPGATMDSFVLPGNVTAFTDSPIYAQASGYLAHWYYDIGARVHKGALLAVISAPDLDQQVAQAQADLLTAQTNAKNAHVQAQRYQGLVTSDAVSKFDTDTFVTQEAATASAVKSAQANLQRLKALQAYEKIYAPFDGVVTARNVDTGQLITAGSTQEMFHLQALHTLRVYTNVPQIYSTSVKRGEKIPLTFPEYPGKTFTGTLVRTADAIDPASRTLLVEVDVDNRSGQLLPGAQAQVHFKAAAIGQTFIVPASALIFRHEGLRVGTVVNGNVAHLVPITIGEDDGSTVQVIAGLNTNDKVIQDPPDSLIEGEKVYVVSGNQTGGGE